MEESMAQQFLMNVRIIWSKGDGSTDDTVLAS
jgi:hypothetical protein